MLKYPASRLLWEWFRSKKENNKLINCQEGIRSALLKYYQQIRVQEFLMSYFLILYKSFEYDINFTSKNLTCNKWKPITIAIRYHCKYSSNMNLINLQFEQPTYKITSFQHPQELLQWRVMSIVPLVLFQTNSNRQHKISLSAKEIKSVLWSANHTIMKDNS